MNKEKTKNIIKIINFNKIMIDHDLIEKIINYNNLSNANYNLLKSNEELQELALVLQQKVLKPNKVKDQEIIDEIGDVIIRLEILKKLYPIQEIQKRVDYKLQKFSNYLKEKKHKTI